VAAAKEAERVKIAAGKAATTAVSKVTLEHEREV